MNSSQPHCVIVGAGHSAAQLCVSLVKQKWHGKITLIGDEPTLPYHRPPLSKTQLNVESPEPLLLIRPDEFYADNNIDVISDSHVESIDRESKQVSFGAQRIAYDSLVLSTGSIPRRPPIEGIEHPKVFQLYTALHAQQLREQIASAKRVVVIGAGFIGLEVASSLRKQGIDVTILELSDRILSRVTSPEVSQWFERLHQSHGVDMQTGVVASSIKESDAGLVVTTSEGNEFTADFVVVGAGVTPNDQLAVTSGIEVDNGILVNEFNQTSDPDIYAMGDCCNQFSELYGTRLRLESVQNASDQAKTVAASIAGTPVAHAALPWFWSDQYDVKFQIAGISNGYDRHIIRGNPESDRSFSVWYFSDEKLIAIDAINDPRSYMAASKIIPAKGCPNPDLIADTTSELKAIIQSSKDNSNASS